MNIIVSLEQVMVVEVERVVVKIEEVMVLGLRFMVAGQETHVQMVVEVQQQLQAFTSEPVECFGGERHQDWRTEW